MRMRTAAPHPTLGLWPETLPSLPRLVEGFAHQDAVWLVEGARRTPGRVIALLRRRHCVVVGTSDNRIVTVSPTAQPGCLLHRTPSY